MAKKEESGVTRQRDLIIAYKRVFGGDKAVILDLMNRFHMLNTHKGDAFMEGQRSVVCHILSKAKVSLKDFDKLISSQSGEDEA